MATGEGRRKITPPKKQGDKTKVEKDKTENPTEQPNKDKK